MSEVKGGGKGWTLPVGCATAFCHEACALENISCCHLSVFPGFRTSHVTGGLRNRIYGRNDTSACFVGGFNFEPAKTFLYHANDNLPSPLKCDCLTDHVAFLSFPNLSFISFPLFMSGCCWLALLSFCFQIYHFLCLDARSFFFH